MREGEREKKRKKEKDIKANYRVEKNKCSIQRWRALLGELPTAFAPLLTGDHGQVT